MDLAPSTVSEHLRILKEAGLVQGTIDGPRRCYCINDGALDFARKLLKEI
jgi:ArsR family transcriptional regulator